MKKGLIIFLSLFCFTLTVCSQNTRYLVAFRHKGATTFSLSQPSAFLSQRAVARRDRYHIPVDSVDLPVPASWIARIASISGVTILNSSGWLNMISIQTTSGAALQQITDLPFVLSANVIAARHAGQRNKTEDAATEATSSKTLDGNDYYNYGSTSREEIALHHAEFLHNAGLRGQGMQIAILDGGFFNYTSLPAFDSINANGQVLSTWDFVDRNSSVTEDHPHGMQCLSTIAANIPGIFTGKAPAASFHLFRTEDVTSEYPIEEFNWACAAERSDSTGADIISSSLGYGYGFSGGFADYPYSDLNGDITISARAADIAASKGLLVVNAAGNSGDDYWKMITTPADGDSVLAIGAVSTSGIVGSFSSYGPSADGRVKPDIASVGVQAMIQSSNGNIIRSNGTSYACPNMAGLSACLWQAFPEVNNMRIFRALREAGSITAAPDNRIGYGIPDLKKAFTTLLGEYATSSVEVGDCKAILKWTTKDVSAMHFVIERKTALDAGFATVAELSPMPGQQLAVHTYEWSDDLSNQPAGQISYRIRQTIDTSIAGNTSLLLGNTLVAPLDNVCRSASSPEMIRLAPNPVNGATATIIFNNNEAIPMMVISLYDMKGAKLMETTGSKTTGQYSKNISIASIPAGRYIISVRAGKKEIATLHLVRL